VSQLAVDELVRLLAERQVPRLALGAEEAAEALGVSRGFFLEHIAPELRAIRRGRRKLYPVRELEAWVAENASRVGDDL
jgi:Helix-turn-helix domain